MFEQPLQWDYRQGKGWTWARSFHGPKAAAPGKAQELIASGYDVTYREEQGPNAYVYATFGGQDDVGTPNEQPIKIWERAVNRVEKSIFEHPSVVNLKNTTVGDNDLLTWLRLAADEKSLRNVDPDVSPVTHADFYSAYDLILAGVESFIVNQPVVRLTETVSSRYARTAIRSNVGSILTPEVMTLTTGNGESAPAMVIDSKALPAGLSGIAKYGYLKNEPQISQAANNRWQVSTEWEAGFWATFLYTFIEA